MAELDDDEKLQEMVRDFLKNCPSEKAGQFIADRLCVAWQMGYKQGRKDGKPKYP